MLSHQDYSAFCVFMEKYDDPSWVSNLGRDCWEADPADKVNGLCKINEEGLYLFSAFLLKLSEREGHVNDGLVVMESTIWFRIVSLQELEASLVQLKQKVSWWCWEGKHHNCYCNHFFCFLSIFSFYMP